MPDKGVIIVEYYWQRKPLPARAPIEMGTHALNTRIGHKTSMVFFKQLRVGDRCWCGLCQYARW